MAIGVERVNVGSEHIGQVPESVERDIEQRDVRAEARRHLGGIRAHHPAADDQHLGGQHARHATEQNATAAEHFL